MTTIATATHPDELIRLARAWAPFGGPGEEVFTTFGVGQTEFYRRVLRALATESGSMAVGEAADLQRHCQQQLERLTGTATRI